MSERWRNVRPAWLLAAAILAGYIIGAIGNTIIVCPTSLHSSCLPAANYAATNFLVQNNGLVVYYHQYYQLFSSMLITGSSLDAAFNAIAVLVLDFITEDNLNSTRYFTVFVTSALVGNLLTLLNGPYYSSAGASGGIFGIYAALITFSFLKDKKIDIPPFILFIVIFVGSSVLPNVNYVAHLGGAIGGFIVGALIYKSAKPSITEYSMVRNSKRLTVIATLLIISLIILASSVQFLYFIS